MIKVGFLTRLTYTWHFLLATLAAEQIYRSRIVILLGTPELGACASKFPCCASFFTPCRQNVVQALQMKILTPHIWFNSTPSKPPTMIAFDRPGQSPVSADMYTVGIRHLQAAALLCLACTPGSTHFIDEQSSRHQFHHTQATLSLIMSQRCVDWLMV